MATPFIGTIGMGEGCESVVPATDALPLDQAAEMKLIQANI